MDVVHERSGNSRFGVWDEEAEIAEWRRCGPRSANDSIHDTIVEMIEELKLSGVLKPSEMVGGPHMMDRNSFLQGEEQEWILIGEVARCCTWHITGRGATVIPAICRNF